MGGEDTSALSFFSLTAVFEESLLLLRLTPQRCASWGALCLPKLLPPCWQPTLLATSIFNHTGFVKDLQMLACAGSLD